MNTPRRRPVLVVEDDPSLRHLYWQALTFEGLQVITAEDGLTALDCLQRAAPSVVILDMNVPRLSGQELHQKMMADPKTRDIPVIVVAGTETAADVAARAAALFQKPVPVQALVEEVRKHTSIAA
jgi:CheY-like chemotaxis protein